MKATSCALLVSAFTIVAPSAQAQDAPTASEAQAAPVANPFAPTVDREPLWQNIVAGMSADDVRRLYPAGGSTKHHKDFTEVDDFVITGKCKAEVNIHHKAGVVDKIVINGDGSIGVRCSDTVLTGLSGKYGQPLGETATRGSILAREGKIYVWTRPGVTMRFKRFSNGAFAGGGLGQASWELTYTTIADDLAL